MPVDIFRIDWYPQKLFIGFSRLKAEQIGVLVQIINLIYIHNGPIKNDERYIGKSCNLTKSKARRIIDELRTLKEIYLTNDGDISHSTCERVLEETRDRIEKYSKNGQKGAKNRWQNQENQEVENGQAIQSAMANTSTNKNTNNKTSISSSTQSHRENNYDIDHHLDDEARRKARENSQGWDQQFLMRKYNSQISLGIKPPSDYPNAAYPAWCKEFTKGKPPS